MLLIQELNIASVEMSSADTIGRAGKWLDLISESRIFSSVLKADEVRLICLRSVAVGVDLPVVG